MADENRLLFIDMETTGLDATSDVPLELAVALTDEWGTMLDSKVWLVHDDTTSFKQAIIFGMQHPIVGQMHVESGLWEDLDNREMASNLGTIRQVENELLAWLKRNKVTDRTVPLAGNSIGSLDRPFLISYFPLVNETLSYRNVDMSSFKEVCKRVNPVLWANIEPLLGMKEDAKHRALDDVIASIYEYKVYLDEFLITAEN
jgi:oligoribonuclease